MRYELKGSYFNGEFHQPIAERSSEKIEKKSPANTDDHLWTLIEDRKHVEPCIQSANDGYKKWRTTSFEERVTFLKRYQEAVMGIKERLAEAISYETGKPYWEALTEAAGVIGKVDVTINESLNRIESKTYENIMQGTTGRLIHKPLGPTVVIGPFNFPCHLANTQILAAILAGNSVIFKPSEKTIYSGQLLIECFHAAQFPSGVVNFICGGGGIATKLIKEKTIKGIYFTGSKEVGGKILDATYRDFSKLVALEMGGKNTSIIHKDANLDLALTELIKACYLTSGQRCVSTSKVAIHSSLQEEFISKFHLLAKKLIIDHPVEYEKEPFMGPLIDETSTKNYLNYMSMAIREGAQEIMRGKVLERKFPGYYVSPSIHLLEKADPKSHFFNSEIFGPNVAFVPYNEIEEAIEIANMSDYGLAAGLFTEDREVYNKCIQDIEVGVLNLNRSTVGASAKLPFGGVKKSGNHHPAAVSMIDSCVYPLASLEINPEEIDYGLDTIKGLRD